MTINAQHHNIEAERVMAITDINIRRSRNASIDFVECKVRTQKNCTLTWMKDKFVEDRSNIINYAIHRASIQRKKC